MATVNAGKQCRDCVAAGITTARPAPHPGPRCHSHNREAVKARKAAAHERRVQAVYGLGPGDYDRILAVQGGVCAICRRAKGISRRLAVDHRHRDGVVRGLLCQNCNFNIIGKLGEDVEALDRAIDYLLDPPAARNPVERWVAVADFDGYEVSDLGRVRSWLRYPWNSSGDIKPRILQSLDNGNGYKQVTLMRGGERFKRHIHRLVAQAFLGPGAEGLEVCHRDNDKANNAAANLRWGTHSSNAIDLVESGSHNTTRLTRAAAEEIRRRVESGELQKALAAEFGVSRSAISSVVKGRTWKAKE